MKSTFIFDMDGVLVDSEPVYLQIHRQYFQNLGIPSDDETIFKLTGLTAHRIFTDVKARHQLHGSVEELVENELDIIVKTFRELPDLQPVAGISELLEKLKLNHKHIGFGSSNTRNMVDLLLEKTGLTPYFEHTVSGDQVQEGKPSPEIFLKVAQLFGAKPEHCVVIEDSFNGVLAAKRAGMYCIGFQNPNSGGQDLSAADLLVSSISEIEVLLNAWQ